MSDLIEYIVMRDCPSGCHYAKEHECLKYKNCDECAKYHIAEHDAKVRADAIDEMANKLITIKEDSGALSIPTIRQIAEQIKEQIDEQM